MSGFKKEDYVIIESKDVASWDRIKPDWRKTMGFEACYERMRFRLKLLEGHIDSKVISDKQKVKILRGFCAEALGDQVVIDEDYFNIRDVIE